MARYKVLELSFHNNRLVQEGEIVEIDDSVMDPGPNFARVDEDDEPAASKPARKSGKKASASSEESADLA